MSRDTWGKPDPKPERAAPKKPKPLKRVSVKRAGQNAEYSVMREKFLKENPLCMNCGDQATELHHAAGRTNDLLLDRQYFRALCHGCHEMATLDTEWAVKMGISVYRNKATVTI